MFLIGLISGTSVDGIDAALVEITGEPAYPQVNFVAGETYPYPEMLRSLILQVCAGKALSMAELAELDDAIAVQFAQAALNLQQAWGGNVDWIGSHGQTLFHRPPAGAALGEKGGGSLLGYSLQLGRGSLIAHLTGIPTISNFRAADIAAGGQGAPLVPPVDACLLRHPTLNRCVQNIGGIGNVAYLPAIQDATSSPPILGWDTGPGNALLDLAVHYFSEGKLTYDRDGAWAASGAPCATLVSHWLQHPFFQEPPPKSTGREIFGVDYLHTCLTDAEAAELSPADCLATLTELTAAAIVHSYRTFLPQMPDQVYLCGGGSRNRYLRQRIQSLLQPIPVQRTDDLGLNSDFKEAIAFAVLAYWRLHQYPGNLPAVTGATQAVLLGEMHGPGKLP